MSIYLIVIVGALLFEYILSCVVKYLDINALDPKLPKEFSDTFDEDKYKESQLYTKEKTKFSIVTSTISLVVSLILIFSGLYNEIDLFARAMDYNEIFTGIIFFGILMVISDIINLPFSIYSTFVIEQKFGFNKTTPKTFISDKIKQYFVVALIGIPIISLVLYFFSNMGSYAWVYVWGALVLFSIAIQPIFNSFIAPLFNKFTPLEEGPLLAKIKAYLDKVEFPIKKLEVVDGSKRSSHSNAYFSGIGKNKRIALFDTLVDQMDDDEIVAVIAHEVGHYKLKHIYSGILLSAAQSGLMLYILSLFLMNPDLFSVFKMDNLSVYASLLFFTMLYAPISIVIGIFFSYISRLNEFSADEYSAKTSGMPHALISGLKKMSKENLSNLTPHWLNVFLNYSHPPVLKRIDALSKFNTK